MIKDSEVFQILNMKKKTKIAIGVIATCLLLILAGVTALVAVWNGIIVLNSIPASRYEVKGIDLSSYQGNIDWQTLSGENISFAFIKATEGSSWVDPCFEENWKNAKECSLSVGAYHFFSFDSQGKTQAENFINTVTPFEGMLPPVIDLEFYGNKANDPPSREYVDTELGTMLEMLEEHYGQKPIIYATKSSYDLYLSGAYEDYDIWFRDVIKPPSISDGRAWTFWQYSNRGRLKGYVGREKFIDLNVFYGSKEDFENYLSHKAYKSK